MQDLLSLKTVVHYFLHLLFPVLIAYFFGGKHWKRYALILTLTMLVDLDHLLADPIFDSSRNSIGFHLFHTYPFIVLYTLGVIFLKKEYRIAAIGLLWHMVVDFQDYYLW